MIIVERHHIKPTHRFFNECNLLAYVSKNLYNSTLYHVRKHYFSNNKSLVLSTEIDPVTKKEKKNWIFDATHLYHTMKDTPEFRTDKHAEYGGLKVNTKVLKQTERQVNNDISNFLKANTAYRKNPSAFKGKPLIPTYRNKRNVVTFPSDALSWRKYPGYVHLAGTSIAIKPHKATQESVKEVKIVPMASGYDIVMSYEIGDVTQITEHTKYASIDLGINNLATLSSNDTDLNPFIINGRPLKSINQYFNKTKAQLTSELPKGVYTSKRIGKLYTKRKHKIRDYMHKSSDFIIQELIKSGITCLIVGSNKHWKTGVRMGKRNNQSFVSIPFYVFKQMLKYKCEMAGIEFIEHEESYTSKCSFLDLEDICKHVDSNGNDNYLGKRVKRGLFRSGSGTTINADMNGSYNILRKVAENDVFRCKPNTSDLVEDYAVSPFRVTII